MFDDIFGNDNMSSGSPLDSAMSPDTIRTMNPIKDNMDSCEKAQTYISRIMAYIDIIKFKIGAK